MINSFIDGYEKAVSYFGYWPSFHDDIIDKLEITSNEIAFYISIQSFPDRISSYSKIKLVFSDVKKFNLEGELYGCLSIILDIEFQINDNIIETQISSSLGARGTIYSNRVQIELE